MNDGSIALHKPKSFIGIYPRPCFLMPHSLDLFCLYSNSELKQSFGLSSFKLLNHRKCHYELQTSFLSCGNSNLQLAQTAAVYFKQKFLVYYYFLQQCQWFFFSSSLQSEKWQALVQHCSWSYSLWSAWPLFSPTKLRPLGISTQDPIKIIW